MIAYITRLSNLKKALSKDYDVIITERSIYTDRNVFAKMLYDSKKINEIEYIAYNQWFDEFSYILKNLKTVYIKTNPEICKTRVEIRSRPGENIPLEYLEQCHLYHENWLNNIKPDEILIIDGNNDIDTQVFVDNYDLDNIIKKIYNFINIKSKEKPVFYQELLQN